MIKNCDEAEHKSNDDSNHNKDNGDCKVIDDTKEANANDVHVIDEQHNENNVANDDDQEAAMIRGIFGELKDVYNDFLLQVRLVQKDLIRASKYDELESKVRRKIAMGLSLSGVRAHINNNWLSLSLAVYWYNVRASVAAEGKTA